MVNLLSDRRARHRSSLAFAGRSGSGASRRWRAAGWRAAGCRASWRARRRRPPPAMPVLLRPRYPSRPPRPPVIGLALGGGAARGFAHIGVIQVLEEAGIRPDLVVGTSAGSLVAALYASGKSGASWRRWRSRWTRPPSPTGRFPGRGLIRGEALARYVREHTGGARDRADDAAAGHRRHRPGQRPAASCSASATRAWRCARPARCRRCSSRCASARASTSTAAWWRRCRCAMRARWAPSW